MISIILNGKEIKINKLISVQQLLIKENLEKKTEGKKLIQMEKRFFLSI